STPAVPCRYPASGGREPPENASSGGSRPPLARRLGSGVETGVDALRLGQIMCLARQVELQARLSGQPQRQPHGERAAAAQLAVQRHLAAEQSRQLARNRKSQAGSRVLACQRVGPLPELLEDQ